MSNPSNQAPLMRFDAGVRVPLGVQSLLDDLDRQYALECETVLVGWQGPSPARARLMDEVGARYRKHKASIIRRLADRVG